MHIRLIGLGIAGLFILVVVLAGLQKRRQQQRFQLSAGELGVLDQPDDSVLEVRRAEPNVESEYDFAPQQQPSYESNHYAIATQPRHTPRPQAQPKAAATEQSHGLTIIHLQAQPGRHFAGYELLQSLLSAGLRYGEMSIFHRHENANGTGKVLFSLASATEPGIFDIQKMGSFACTGLSLFMRNTGNQEHDQAVYDLMIQTAEKVAQDLGGDLFDAERQPIMTAMAV